YFEHGPGVHTPTFAAKIDLDQERFEKIYWLFQDNNYLFDEYSLTSNQCASFASKVCALAGVTLDSEITIDVPQTIFFENREIQLWQDPRFSTITVAAPDVVEKSLMELVEEGKAEVCTSWYRKEFPKFKSLFQN